MKANLTLSATSDERGFTLFEILLVVACIVVLTGYALVQISTARQTMARANAAREFAAYLEKARLDSVRRHSDTTAQMAQVTIINSTFYSVTLDSNGDGTMDAPRVMSLGPNIVFNGPFPRTIMFNWRGRTVDSSGIITTPLLIAIGNGSRVSRIRITNAGQSTLDHSITSDPVTTSSPPPANFRSTTQFP